MLDSACLLQRIRYHGSVLSGIFSVLNGGRMPCSACTDENLQNAHWESFTQCHEVMNLFVRNLFGKIIYAAVNFPGCWHDSKLAVGSGLYTPRLADETPASFVVLGDSVSVECASTARKSSKSTKINEPGSASADVPHSAWIAAVDALVERAMHSERQSAEWGVRAVNGPFACMKVSHPADAYARSRIITICAHMNSFRARLVGFNQIRSVYTGGSGHILE